MKTILPLLLCISQLLLNTATAADVNQAPVQNLVQIYQLAVQNDPELAAAVSANKASQELINQAKAGYRPNVTLGANATKTWSDFAVVGPSPFRGGPNNFETYNYGLQAAQPIFRKDRLIKIDQSKIAVEQADKQLALSKQDLMLKTTQAYFDVLLAQDTIDLIDAQKASILSQLEQAKVTFDVGTSTITDVNEAQARYDLVLAQEISAINGLQIAQRALQILTGELPTHLATVNPSLETENIQESMADWQAITAKQNLQVQIQQDAVTLAQKDIAIAKAARYPNLDATASYTDNYSNGGLNGFGNDTQQAILGLQVDWPIYQGGSINSKVRQSVHQQQQAKDQLEAIKRKTDLETQRSYLNLSTSIAQVKALEQALKSSKSQLDSTKLGYEVGVRTSVDVLNAQQQFYSANKDLLEARYSYLVNIVRLKYAAGMLADADIAAINQQLRTDHAE